MTNEYHTRKDVYLSSAKLSVKDILTEIQEDIGNVIKTAVNFSVENAQDIKDVSINFHYNEKEEVIIILGSFILSGKNNEVN